MNLLDNLSLGFSVALTAWNLFYCFVGVLLGTFIGVLPGIGPLVTIAVLLPLTFGLPPEGSLIMLAGIYYGASYGGSTTAILVNLPGESSSVVTCIDGYQMARQGRAGAALSIAAIGSFFAGCVGTVMIAAFGPPLASIALSFNSAEYFSLMVLALMATAALVHGSLIRGLLMGMTGVLFGLVGMDVYSGQERYTFGMLGLAEGIHFVVVAMGIFGFAEIIRNLEQTESGETYAHEAKGLMPTWADIKAVWKTIVRATGVGAFFGILPGAGPTISAFAAYMLEKRIAKDSSRFGQGAIEGVAAPESANNAAAQTSFIPTLTLGIPGSATMALMLGALMIQGINPGPQVIREHPNLFWGLVASMWIGNVMLVILNLPLVGLWVKMLKIPYRWLYPSILAFACVGVFTVNGSALDLVLTAFFALLGYLFVKLELELTPFILGFVLGPMLEENLRRAMLVSRGDPMIFLERPISAGFLAAATLLLVSMAMPAVRRGKERAIEESD
jgi:TctA family transporter